MMKRAALLLMLFITASLCEEYTITFFLSARHTNGILSYPQVIVHGTDGDSESHECTADLSRRSSNSSCIIQIDQNIGDLKCLNIRTSSPESVFNQYASIAMLIVERPNKAKKYFTASDWSNGVILENYGAKDFCDPQDALPPSKNWFPGQLYGDSFIHGEYYSLYWMVSIFTVVPVFLILILTFFGISCCRGNVCPCSHRENAQDIQNIVTVQA